MLFEYNLLLFLLITPLLGCFSMLIVQTKKLIKEVSFRIFSIIFILSLIIWTVFKSSVSGFQLLVPITWISYININCFLGIDGISLFFLLLTTLLFPLCIIIDWTKDNQGKNYFLIFFSLEFFLIGAFCSLELLLFYIFFESVLLPMFLIIGIWGSRERKIKASYYFFFIYFIWICFNVIINYLYIY